MKISALNRKLHRAFGGRVTAALADGCIVLRGELERWDDVVRAGQMAATKYSTCHVVNDITFTGGKDAPMRVPALHDDALDGQTPDVLIIGGGISGVSIARELARQKLDILVVDKECDLALGASGRNDGEVHPGIDLGRGSIKHKYIRRGNAMYDQVCKELDVPFHRVGQYVCFQHGWLRPAVWGYCMWRKYHDGIADTELISGRELLRREPNFNKKTRFAISNPDSGCVCPYGLTIAYAENAVQNGARIALNTAVLGMDVADGQITAVHTNRGTLRPALVINAAGVFAEDVARMADDRFFSIHPRRGTNSILDRKAGAFMHSIASVKGSDMVSKTHSKGGGILHTVHDNLLIGPDAVETYEKREHGDVSREHRARIRKAEDHDARADRARHHHLFHRCARAYVRGGFHHRARPPHAQPHPRRGHPVPRPDDGARHRGRRGGHGRAHPRARAPRGHQSGL